jgi:hypothetical protein
MTRTEGFIGESDHEVSFIALDFFLMHMSTNKNIHIWGDRKFHELSEYVISFQKAYCYDNDNLKIQSAAYFFQGDRSNKISITL